MMFERVSITTSDPLSFVSGDLVVAPVAYETAIVGLICDSTGTPRFPATSTWLLQHQAADGTWGSLFWHAHDRLVSTLAAALCLHTHQRGAGAIMRGIAAIPMLLEQLTADAHETVGFELIAPALLDRCAALGWPIPSDTLPRERARRAQRLQSGLTGTAVFSLEAVDTMPQAFEQLISPRGSLFASPSAAAAYLMQYPDAPALAAHLDWLVGQNHGGIPAVHPLDSFVAAWTCWHMDLAGLGASPGMARLRDMVRRTWAPQGASFSDDFGLPNADDTALNMLVQAQDGPCPDIAVLAPFLSPDGAHCYPHEYDPSVSTNIHVLMALRAAPPSPQRTRWIAWVLDFLRQMSREDHLITDKWHVSPIYPTSHAVLATSHLDDTLCATFTEVLLQAQHADGAWGLSQGSAEETAYALLALCRTYRPAFGPAIAAGIGALERLATTPRPALWIGKSLYRPIPVVESAILAAWHLAHTYLHP